MKRLETIKKHIFKDINELYYAVQEYILKRQNENNYKYLDTQDENNGRMYYYAYDEDERIVEGVINGIRVYDGCIQILGTPIQKPRLTFDEDWFIRAGKVYDGEIEDEDSEEIDICWQNIYDSNIIYWYTLLSIADNIKGY